MAINLYPNQIIVAGNIGRAESKTLSSGTVALSGSLAWQRSYKKGDSWENETQWFNWVAYNPTKAEEKLLQKGSRVLITGELRSRSYEDASGNKRYVTEIVVQSVTPVAGLDGNGNGSSDTKPAETKPATKPAKEEEAPVPVEEDAGDFGFGDDDLPF